MIEQQGRVVAVEGDHALVVIERQSACGGCQAKSGCGTSLVSSLFPSRALTLRLANTQGAKVGERILVGLPEVALQLAALLLYGVPLLGLLLGAVMGKAVAEGHGWGGEPLAILGGLLGLIAGLFAARRLGDRNGMRPVMLGRAPVTQNAIPLDALQPQPKCSTEK